MKLKLGLPIWTIVTPLLAWVLYFGETLQAGGFYSLFLAFGLIGAVMAAVHHAKVIAHKVGKPFGTKVLAIAVTVIEVSLIISLMLAEGPETTTLARDTVFAAIIIILTAVGVIVALVFFYLNFTNGKEKEYGNSLNKQCVLV